MSASPKRAGLAAVWGLGRFGGGEAAAYELLRRGHRLRIIDRRSFEDLAPGLVRLAASIGSSDPRDIDVQGEHEGALADVDLLCVNPGVRPEHPLLAAAKARGIACTQELDLFLEAYPGRVTAVTGTNGKSSTTSMLARALEAATRRPVLAGGNIGGSLLELRRAWRADQDCVLEISSFQASRLNLERRPLSGLVLPYLGSDHLAWHGSRAAYHAAKLRLLEGLREGGPALLGGRGPREDGACDPRLHLLTATDEPTITTEGLVYGGRLVLARCDLSVAGSFQLENARLALALVARYGLDVERAARGLRGYTGLPHRLVEVGVRNGIRFFDNGVSTTVDSTLSALRSLVPEGRVHWVGGGRSKGEGLEAHCDAARLATSAQLFGEVGPDLARAMAAAGLRARAHAKLRDALEAALATSRHGDVILFSPAFSSFDQYPNFEVRAQSAVAWWHGLAGRVDEAASDAAS